DQAAREREVGVRPHPESARELHREPALHAASLHDDALALERARERPAHDVAQNFDQLLGAVAAMDVHGCDDLRGATSVRTTREGKAALPRATRAVIRAAGVASSAATATHGTLAWSRDNGCTSG